MKDNSLLWSITERWHFIYILKKITTKQQSQINWYVFMPTARLPSNKINKGWWLKTSRLLCNVWIYFPDTLGAINTCVCLHVGVNRDRCQVNCACRYMSFTPQSMTQTCEPHTDENHLGRVFKCINEEYLYKKHSSIKQISVDSMTSRSPVFH